jgi:hypothetical protein
MAVKPDETKAHGPEGGSEKQAAGAQAATMPRDKYHIQDLASFDQITSGKNQAAGHEVAGLYFYKVIGNPLIDVAGEVSRDFFRRPHIFTEPSSATAKLVAQLGARMGSHETIPSNEQRAAIFSPLFGESSNEDDFPRLRDELIHAASAFAERSFDTGVGMLRERVRETHRPFKEYLTGLEGASTSWSRAEALPGVTEGLAFPILRSSAVSSAYGISHAPRKEWPYTEDANGDKLVEEVSKRDTVTNPMWPLKREVFSNLQRAALRGAEALALILDFDEGGAEAEVDLLIEKVYTWGAALLPEQRMPRTAPPVVASPSPA